MARTIYQNNDVLIELERVGEYELKVNCNGGKSYMDIKR